MHIERGELMLSLKSSKGTWSTTITVAGRIALHQTHPSYASASLQLRTWLGWID